ncbi:unnamed protein product [Rhizophagus irregularis]|nr:unnamed protein product [Rhizophagus irregularis]
MTIFINFKNRNWLAFYHEKNTVAYLGKVIETETEGTIVEHWIHDIGIDNISFLVQLPIIKKCAGCDLKEFHTKSKRKSIKQRYLLTIDDTNRSVKINAKSIKDRYILDMSVFEYLAKAENNSITKLVDNIIDQTPSNLLTFVHLIRVRDNLSRIKNSLESIKDIEAYTDGSFKKYTIISVDIGNTFLISSPKKLEFNVNITDNPSAFKNNSETLAEIEWSSTFRVLKGNTELTNFIEHELNLFKVKIWTEELPTLDNLIKRKPYVYNSKWKCPMCFKDKKTYSHLWKCEHLEQVYLNMINKFQQYLQELILVNSQMENVNPDDIFKEISRCKIWDFNKTYNLSILAKSFIHIDLVNLFISYRILDKDRIRNIKLADLEHQKGINAKMKKSANKSKLVVNKLDKIVSSHWEL